MAETRYLPYGEERWTAGGAQPTDFTFTGQRAERGFGLMDYRARYYDPRLGRFICADSIAPEPGNPQALNRYAYAYNNPLKYNDPTGHNPPPPNYPLLGQATEYFESLGWKVVGDPAVKSLSANGADVVFTRGKDVLAVELKAPRSGKVTLSTLKKGKLGDYGGSISRVMRAADRFAESPVDQLRQESQVIREANRAGKLQNALFTSGEGISDKAQGQFDAVYKRTSQGTVKVVKPLPRSGTWSSVKDAVNTRIFNLNIGARLYMGEAVSILEKAPVPVVPNPNFYYNDRFLNPCSPDRCEPLEG